MTRPSGFRACSADHPVLRQRGGMPGALARRRAEPSESPTLPASHHVVATLDDLQNRLGIPMGASLVVMPAPWATDWRATSAVDSALTQSGYALRSDSVLWSYTEGRSCIWALRSLHNPCSAYAP